MSDADARLTRPRSLRPRAARSIIMVDESQLSEQQLRFAHEYAAEPNATQAYLRAYPNANYNTARTEGPKLLAIPAIKAELDAARESHQEACQVTGVRTLQALAAIAFADPVDIFDEDADGLPMPKRLSKVSARVRKAIQAVKVKRRRLKSDKDATGWEVEELEFKFADKMAAFDKLCRHLGLTKDGAGLEDLIHALRGNGTSAEAPPGAGAVQGSQVAAVEPIVIDRGSVK